MRIRFGRNLDGEQGSFRTNNLDFKTVGPLGLLDILETQLGLPHTDVPQIERVMVYLSCLKQADHPLRFFHKTFAVDDLETARTLLQWRDQWYLHGWSGQFANQPGGRLADMQDVEVKASKLVPLSEGQRLVRIAKKIQKRKPRISSIELCEPLKWHPWTWQQVLQKLPLKTSPAYSLPPANTLLRNLQDSLIPHEQDKKPPKLHWQDDGSLTIVRADTSISAGYWLGSLLHNSSEDTLLVAPKADILVDTFKQYDLPQPNFQELSAFRPTLQLLPLALSQIWDPVNVHDLLSFLAHPLCPIPSDVRKSLVQTLIVYPGIGGEPWNNSLKKIEARWEKKDLKWREALKTVHFWLEDTRYSSVTGAPISFVLERVAALLAYFRVQLGHEDLIEKSKFSRGYSQTQACYNALLALSDQGETHIGINKLQTIISQCTTKGAENPLRVAQARSCRKIENPGAAIDTADRVIWWQLQAPPLPKPYLWSAAELATLRANGVHLPEIADELDRNAWDWRKPILAAQNQLILVLPPARVEVHPLWLMIESLFDKDHKPHIVNLEKLIEHPDNTCLCIERKTLPKPKRWWQISKEIMLPKRETESFSSLETFLFNPYHWVLKYQAKLVPASIVSVSDLFQLYGNLSHTLIERFFNQPNALSLNRHRITSWFDSSFDHLMVTEGALLLMPGRRTELANFREDLLRAISELQRQLVSANVVKIESEVKLQGHFPGGSLVGYADLLVTDSVGRQAIIDMKWAGGTKYPDKLAQNRHLQLVLYGEMVRQHYGTWPSLSYFIISQAKLIAPDREFFPNAQYITKDKEVMDEGSTELWNRFLVTWNWRRELLDQGLIEIAVDDSEISEAPSEGMVLEILNQKYNDYLSLAGWDEVL